MVNFKSPDERRSEFVGVRITIDERLAAEKIARRAGLSLSELCRRALAEYVEANTPQRGRQKKRG